jgi:hypothetical protein
MVDRCSTPIRDHSDYHRALAPAQVAFQVKDLLPTGTVCDGSSNIACGCECPLPSCHACSWSIIAAGRNEFVPGYSADPGPSAKTVASTTCAAPDSPDPVKSKFRQPMLRTRIMIHTYGDASFAQRSDHLCRRFVVGRSSTQVPRDEDDGKDRPQHSVLDVSNEVPAVEIVTTDPMTMLRGLLGHSWEALERCRWGEELLHEKGLPTHCLVAARTQLGKVMGSFLRECRRNDAQALFIKHVVGSEGCPPAPLSDAAKQALKEILKQVSPKHRGVLRQLLDRA